MRGFATLAEAMDAFGFPRIAPASALPGDVIAIPGDDAIGCLMIAVGNGRALGYHKDADGATILQPTEFVAAWRV